MQSRTARHLISFHQAIVFYDYISNLPREIELIWGRGFSTVTLMYHLNRWLTLAWAVIGLLQSHLGKPEYESSLSQKLSVRAESLHDIAAKTR